MCLGLGLASTVRRSPRRLLLGGVGCGEVAANLHRWARDDAHRRFDDLFNLVADPGFLLVAWDRVRGNKGAATAGVDGQTAASIAAWKGVEEFLDELRCQLKDRSFTPLPVRERMISRRAASCARWGSRPCGIGWSTRP